jgi:hypothetical protein
MYLLLSYGLGLNAYKILVGILEGKRKLGKPKHKWENTTEMYITEVTFGGVERINLPDGSGRWRALVNTAMNIRAPQKVGNLVKS